MLIYLSRLQFDSNFRILSCFKCLLIQTNQVILLLQSYSFIVANLFESAEKLLLPEFPTYSLFVTPPHVNLVMEKTFAEQHLAPSSIVHIIFDTTRKFYSMTWLTNRSGSICPSRNHGRAKHDSSNTAFFI